MVYSGITTQTNFYNHFLKSPHKVVWLLKPTEVREIQIRALQHQALDKLEAILKIPLTNESGEISNSRISETIKMVQVLFGVIDKF